MPRSSLPPNWPPLPSEEELERSFTQWEREQQAPHPVREPLEHTKQFNPSAVVEAAWEEPDVR